jgi:hypothetical protein
MPPKTFNRGEEVSVTQKEYEYLQTIVEKKLQTKGNGYVVVDIPRFSFRTEGLTQEEKVLEEVADVPDTLGPKKPGRPKKE